MLKDIAPPDLLPLGRMPAALTIQLNGHPRTITQLSSPADMSSIINCLLLKPDRIAVEHNGNISPRAAWPTTQVSEGDRLEIVHFVGGGAHDRAKLK